jgi:hypothetical protein
MHDIIPCTKSTERLEAFAPGRAHLQENVKGSCIKRLTAYAKLKLGLVKKCYEAV